MRQDYHCTECGGCHYGDSYKCDSCGEDMTTKYHGIPITVDFSYGHPLDGATYHFCEYRCLLKFITQELRKENPRPIITGDERDENS